MGHFSSKHGSAATLRRPMVFAALGLLVLFAIPAAEAHIVKIDDENDCRGYWVDQDPTDNDLLGYDPDAVVVIHGRCYIAECPWLSTILGCSHGDPIP